jgi:hypothetical protein
MTVVPEMATETPKPSAATVSDPFSSASCLPIGTVVRDFAPIAEAGLASSGREIAPTAIRMAIRDVRI